MPLDSVTRPGLGFVLASLDAPASTGLSSKAHFSAVNALATGQQIDTSFIVAAR